MGFYSTKPAFRAALTPVARTLGVIHPDVWTWIAVGVCGVAGLLLLKSQQHPVWLLVVPALLFVRLLLNVLDGVIAQETQTASARGEALSEFADRLSDVAVLIGFALSGFGAVWLSMAATIVVLLVSYVGILGKAVGAGRQYGGLMGKPDRMVVVMAACVIQYVLQRGGGRLPSVFGHPLTAFDWGSVAIIVLGTYTLLFRLRAIFRALPPATPRHG